MISTTIQFAKHRKFLGKFDTYIGNSVNIANQHILLCTRAYDSLAQLSCLWYNSLPMCQKEERYVSMQDKVVNQITNNLIFNE